MNFVAFPSQRIFKSQEDAIEDVIDWFLNVSVWGNQSRNCYEWCVKEFIEGKRIEDSNEVVTEGEIFTLMKNTGRLKDAC